MEISQSLRVKVCTISRPSIKSMTSGYLKIGKVVEDNLQGVLLINGETLLMNGETVINGLGD